MRARASLAALTVPFVLAAIGGAQAAPQILALVASADPVPLVCRNGECAADFSTFCLQEDRASPVEGARYTAFGGEGIRLVATTRDGRTVGVSADTALTITTARTHTMVRIAIDVSVPLKRGYQQVAALVGENVSLVPVPYANDPRPQTEADIALATGPLRRAGAKVVDLAGEPVLTAALVNRLRGTLPSRGRASPEERLRAWDATFGADADGIAASAPGVKARQAYEECLRMTESGMSNLRECLGAAHDKYIGKLNNEYWDDTKFGF